MDEETIKISDDTYYDTQEKYYCPNCHIETDGGFCSVCCDFTDYLNDDI